MAKKSTPPKSTPAPTRPVAVPKNLPGKSGNIGLNSMPKYQAPPPPPPKKKS
jgi:hypothetical protein